MGFERSKKRSGPERQDPVARAVDGCLEQEGEHADLQAGVESATRMAMQTRRSRRKRLSKFKKNSPNRWECWISGIGPHRMRGMPMSILIIM
jgi:hypothetical protein